MKTVVITGATRGLGRELVFSFLKQGYAVLGLYASDEASAESLRAEISGESCVLLQHDVRENTAGAFCAHEWILSAKELVLVNNAWCAFQPTPFHLLKWEATEQMLHVGVKGSLNMMQGLLRPMLKAEKGRVVNVLTSAAVAGELPPKGYAGYLAAKQALRGLMLGFAAEYGSRGLKTFSVSPGFMETSLTAAWDTRLLDAVRASGAVCSASRVAEQVVRLVEETSTPGVGEDYAEF